MRRTTFHRFFKLTLLFALALQLHAPRALSAACAPSETKTVTLTEKNDGGRARLAPGDVLVVRLGAQLGTGYGWRVTKSDVAILEQAGEPRVEPDGEGRPGAAEVQVFRFKTLAAGRARLELQYVRPWEKGARPSKTFRVNVKVE